MSQLTIDNDLLMDAVRKYPAIYNKAAKEYRDKHAKINAWEEVIWIIIILFKMFFAWSFNPPALGKVQS